MPLGKAAGRFRWPAGGLHLELYTSRLDGEGLTSDALIHIGYRKAAPRALIFLIENLKPTVRKLGTIFLFGTLVGRAARCWTYLSCR